MFEEAATMSASALKHLHDNRPMYVEDKITLLEMMESSAMVLAQSWKGAGRYVHFNLYSSVLIFWRTKNL